MGEWLGVGLVLAAAVTLATWPQIEALLISHVDRKRAAAATGKLGSAPRSTRHEAKKAS